MTKKLDFAVEHIEFLKDENDSQFATAEIEAFSSGDNLHDYTCSVDVLKKTAYTIYEKPVIFEVDPNFYDFGTHNEDITVPAGFVVPNTAEYVERPDGRISLKVMAKIWKRYAKDFIKIFKLSNNANKSVSVEMEIFDYGEQDNRGFIEMKEFAYTAITVLGDFVSPASEGANMQMVSFAKDKADYEMAYRFEFAKYSELDFSIPNGVKKNAQNGLNIRSKNSNIVQSFSDSDVALADYIILSDSVSPEKAREIFEYFSREDVNRPSNKHTPEWTKWQLHGGNTSKSWITNLVDGMDVADDELLAYFDKSVSEDIEGRKENLNMEENMEELQVEEEIVTEEVEFESDGEVDDENVTMEEAPAEEDMAEEDESEEEDMAEEEESEEEDMADDADEEEEGEEDMSTMMGDLMGLFEVDDPALLFATISDRIAELESDNAELKEFKEGVEQTRFEYEVDSVLSEVKEHLTEDAITQAREDAKEFSLETLDGWKNAVKAQAFASSKDVVEEDDGITRIETIFATKKKSDSVWN